MPNGDVHAIRFICRASEQVAFNVTHWETVAIVGVEPTRQDIATTMDGTFAASYRSLLNNHAEYRGVDVTRVLPLPRSSTEISTASAGAGNGTGDLLPKQVSGLIGSRTALGTRRGRGRIYIPFPGEDDSTADALPNAAYLVVLGALAALFALPKTVTGGAGSMTIRPVILHRVGAPPSDPVTGAAARTRWATQRRRGSFGRPNVAPF